jgi:hypothetical protein
MHCRQAGAPNSITKALYLEGCRVRVQVGLNARKWKAEQWCATDVQHC